MKPIIGLLGIVDEERSVKVAHSYVEAIEDAGGAAILLPYSENEQTLTRYIDICNGLLFTGGVDIDPCRYGEPKKDMCGQIQPYRDSLELAVFERAFSKRLPILAICRGAQLVNVALGGTLYQDIKSEVATEILHRQNEPTDATSHSVSVIENTPLHHLSGAMTLAANSFHHQAVKLLGEGLEVMAQADDGIIEAFYYNGESYLRAYQWHPERIYKKDEKNRLIFEDFIANCR